MTGKLPLWSSDWTRLASAWCALRKKWGRIMEWIIGLALLAAAGISYLIQSTRKEDKQRAEDAERESRRARLLAKYAGQPYAEDIANGTLRLGMNLSEVIDAWGPPEAVEERVLKTKVVQSLKYGQINSRSFRQQVKIENGVVVGWTTR